ncbi:hypothetical protein [Muricomes intestini]|uniref:hypothetical protein n=1 Tax=Muricomes intestini TaxID=1796634 RepID=UPI002FDD5DFC
MADVRRLLAENNIDYNVKTINRKSPSPFSADTRVRTGTLGESLEFEYEYVIYVKKVDFEKAISAVNYSMEGM